MGKRPSKPTKAPPRVRQSLGTAEATYLVALSLAVIVCFYPLTRYFLAQDDFILIENAWQNGLGAFFDFFQGSPGQFRPLTKALYFWLTYPVFGLNAFAYHLLSLAVYVLNVWMSYWLLRRLRTGIHAALVATTLFALSVAFFDIIAWASCMQQLMAQTFFLASMILGIKGLATNQVRPRVCSLVAYAAALMSFEQTFGIPLLLLLIARLGLNGTGVQRTTRDAIRALGPHLVLMVVYLAFMILWKGVPRDGSYAFALGRNLAVNLTTYLGWVTAFGADFPTETSSKVIQLGAGHAVLGLLVAYHVWRRRFRELVFGVSYYMLCISPTLFLSEHTFYLHAYVPAFGFTYLIARAFDDVFQHGVVVRKRAAPVTVVATLAIMFVVSFTMVRHNERDRMHDSWFFRKNFVLRREEIAENAYRSMLDTINRSKDVASVYLVYGRPGGKDTFNVQNVREALGHGSAIRLFYKKKDLDVRFALIEDPVETAPKEPLHLYYFDDVGKCSLADQIPE